MSDTVVYPSHWHRNTGVLDDDFVQGLLNETRPNKIGDAAIGYTKDGESVADFLDKLDQLRHLAQTGRMKGFVLVSFDAATGLPLTEVRVDRSRPQELLALMGLLDTIKIELGDSAMFMPVLQLDGSIMDPFREDYDD